MSELIRASADDFERITEYYRFVIDNTPTMSEFTKWKYGLHPSDGLIRGYIEDGALFYSEKDGVLLSAAVILPYQDGEYRDVKWRMTLSDDETATLHIFCVNPLVKGQGIGRQTIAAAEEYARGLGKKAMRLDTLHSNIAAQRLYESSGYVRCDRKTWYTCNIGVTDFFLYEKWLDTTDNF